MAVRLAIEECRVGRRGQSWKDRWQSREYTAPNEHIELMSIGVDLALSGVYANVTVAGGDL